MAARIRNADWRATPLGPIEHWPQSLRTALDMVLAMAQPASLFWDPLHVQLYNDAYIAIAQDRHPALLGKPVAEGWPDAYDVAIRPVVEASREGRSTRLTDFVVALRTVDGRTEERVFTVDWSPVRNEAGVVAGSLMISTEVTERRHAERALRESEARHRLLVESWAQAVWETDPEGVVVADSPSWRAYTGQTLKAWLGYGWLDAIHPDDRAFAERQWRNAVAARSLVDAEFRLRAPDGGWRWTNVRAAPVLDDAGRVEKWIGMNVDIDARKRMEQALTVGEKQQAFLLRLSDALRPIGDPVEIQRTATRLLGEQLRANRVFYVVVEEDEDTAMILANYADGVPQRLGRYSLSAFSSYAAGEWRAGRTASTEDVNTDSRWGEAERAAYASVSTRAGFGVPLIKEGRLVALLGVNQSTTRRWTDDEKELAREVAERTWAAVERARAEAALRQTQERNALLVRFSDAVRGLTDPHAVAEAACRIIVEMIGAERAYWAEVDWSTREYVVGAAVHGEGVPVIGGRFPLDAWEPFTSLHLAGQPVVVSDTQAEPRLLPAVKEGYAAIAVGADLAVPVLIDGRLRSTLAVNQRHARQWNPEEVALVSGIAGRCWSEVERARAEAALRTSEERFRQFAQASASGLWIRSADTLAMEYASPAISTIYGVEAEALLGDMQAWTSLVVPEDRDTALKHIERALHGEATFHEFRIRRPSDRSFRWIRSTAFPLFGRKNVVERIGGIAEDVTEAKLAVDHQRVLLAELQHRVRNIMAIIRSMSLRTADGAVDIEDYRSLLEGRLLALARVQALLTREVNAGGSLRDIIASEVSAQAHSGDQFELDGPEIRLSPKAVEVLTLAFHELATNALKYGAFSTPQGRLRVTWAPFEKQGRPWLALDWTEEGSPRRAPPTRRGFGSDLIEGRIPYELGGVGNVVVGPGGAYCRLEFPLKDGESILETDAPLPTKLFGGVLDMTDGPDLTGRRVLVVEDDYYMAGDTAAALRGAGAEVLGPCPSQETASELLERATPTHAILDLNLGGGGPRFEIAHALRHRGVPFIFLTGYDPETIPAELADVVRLQKPVPFRRIVEAIGRL
jgi:PAS domain S-box-containing protein